jgi:hypothetical protein
MKKTILISVIVLTAGLVNAQIINESVVPSSVKATFYSICPEVIVDKIDTVPIKWEKKKTQYLAQFERSNTTKYVIIGLKGNWIETKTSIKVLALPKSATEYIKANYAGKKVIKSLQINHSSGKVTYEVELENAVLYFDADGGFISASKKKISSQSSP